MNKDELLVKLRLERPEQVIHEVLSFKKNKHGFYNVDVNMETMFFKTKIKNTHITLPYPCSEYEKLTEGEQFNWRWEN